MRWSASAPRRSTCWPSARSSSGVRGPPRADPIGGGPRPNRTAPPASTEHRVHSNVRGAPDDDPVTMVTRWGTSHWSRARAGTCGTDRQDMANSSLGGTREMAASARNTGAGRPWPQVLALAFGAIYLLVGIVGFFVTGFDNFAGNEQIGRA